MMVRGQVLFKALEESAETQELRLLTRSYRRHLEFELTAYRKGKRLIYKRLLASSESFERSPFDIVICAEIDSSLNRSTR